MLSVSIDNIGDLAVIECAGRIVQSDAVFQLRDAFRSQGDAQVIVLDLSEVHTIEGSGVGMLVYLLQWAQDRHIRVKLFNPRQSVRNRLEQVSSIQEFDIATLDEIMALLSLADSRYARAGDKSLKVA